MDPGTPMPSSVCPSVKRQLPIPPGKAGYDTCAPVTDAAPVPPMLTFVPRLLPDKSILPPNTVNVAREKLALTQLKMIFGGMPDVVIAPCCVASMKVVCTGHPAPATLSMIIDCPIFMDA